MQKFSGTTIKPYSMGVKLAGAIYDKRVGLARSVGQGLRRP